MRPALCRAARELLGWTQEELSAKAGVGRVTVGDYEAFKTTPRRATLTMLANAFKDAGVEITGGDELPGLRVLRPEILEAPVKSGDALASGAGEPAGEDGGAAKDDDEAV